MSSDSRIKHRVLRTSPFDRKWLFLFQSSNNSLLTPPQTLIERVVVLRPLNLIQTQTISDSRQSSMEQYWIRIKRNWSIVVGKSAHRVSRRCSFYRRRRKKIVRKGGNQNHIDSTICCTSSAHSPIPPRIRSRPQLCTTPHA